MERQAKAGPDGVYREKTDKTVKSAFWDDMIALLLGLMIIAAVGLVVKNSFSLQCFQ